MILMPTLFDSSTRGSSSEELIHNVLHESEDDPLVLESNNVGSFGVVGSRLVDDVRQPPPSQLFGRGGVIC